LQGLIYHYLGSQRLAEKTLRDAAKIDPNSHQTWYYMTSIDYYITYIDHMISL